MAFRSHIRIIHGSTTILDYDDKIESLPVIDGAQEIQVERIARGDGVALFPRDNESHTITFTLAEKVSNAWTSIRAAFDHGINLPKTKGTVSIYFNDSDTSYYRLTDAVIESWPASHDESRESFVVNIKGSLMSKITP